MNCEAGPMIACRSLISSLFMFLCLLPAMAQEAGPAESLDKRARSESYPVSIALPEGWESFQGDPKVQGEVLFLQSAESGSLNATLTLSAFPMPKVWDDLLRRETFQLVVEMDAPVIANEALNLRGAKGHKWAYRGVSSKGESMVYYRLYLALPVGVGGNRLLVLHASAPAAQTTEALALFGSLARSLAWGGEPAP